MSAAPGRTALRANEEPLVSVVIRSYNRGERLARAIDSALAQTSSDFELLVIDDASSDGSPQMVRERYAGVDRLRLIAQARNLGAGGAANVGVGEARGRYVAFLDSDDEWRPQFLEAHLAALRAQPRALLSYCDYIRVFDDYALEQPVRCRPFADQRRQFLLGGFIHSMSLTVTLRDAILMAGGFEERYAVSHDFDLWLRLALAAQAPFVHVAGPLARHRVSTDGVTSHSERWLEEYQDALRRGYQHPGAEPFRDQHREARRRVALGIVARRQLVRWVREPAPRSIGVVVIARGAGCNLRRAVASLRAQTWPDFDAVVVLDGDVDPAEAQWVSELEDPRIRLARFESSRPPGRLINAGVSAVSGELLAFLGADDRWSEDYLERQLRAHSVLLPAPVFTFADSAGTLDRAGAAERSGPAAPDSAAGDRHCWPSWSSDLFAHALCSPFPRTLSALCVARSRLADAGGADEALPVGVEVDLVLRLLLQGDGPEQVAAATNPPVRIAVPLVERGADRERRAAQRELAEIYALDVFRTALASERGRDYAWLRLEAARNLARNR